MIRLLDDPAPYKAPGRLAVHFWIEKSGQKYLCRITYEALSDDYREPGDADPLDIFDRHQEDILDRVESNFPENPNVVDGEPTVIIMSRN